MILTQEDINDAMGQYSKQLGYNPEAATHFGIGANWAIQAMQPRPIAELEEGYRGILLLYKFDGKLEVRDIGYIEEYKALQKYHKYYTHFFIPPTLK